MDFIKRFETSKLAIRMYYGHGYEAKKEIKLTFMQVVGQDMNKLIISRIKHWLHSPNVMLTGT